MNTSVLCCAAIAIMIRTGKQVTAIQFEDGSGLNFNVQLEGGPWEFHQVTEKETMNIFIDY